MADVKLHGSWNSPFSARVKWALALKGVPFDYVEEDLANKSSLLLKYNPVYKKIPVLVHSGKPVCESMIILEYIDETWPQNPLLPIDPHDRAVARFWIKFVEERLPKIWTMFTTKGEEQEIAKKESFESLKIIEEHCLAGGMKFFGGDKIGMVDLAMGRISVWLPVLEKVLGFELVSASSFPKLKAWSLNFKEVIEIKEHLPDHEALLGCFKRHREMKMASSRESLLLGALPSPPSSVLRPSF